MSRHDPHRCIGSFSYLESTLHVGDILLVLMLNSLRRAFQFIALFLYPGSQLLQFLEDVFKRSNERLWVKGRYRCA